MKNEGLDYASEVEEYNAKKTLISVQPYREFATKYPDQTNYFQPILDVLDYMPSKLDSIPDVIMVEGKNDYYTINYMAFLTNNKSVHLLPCTGADSMSKFITLYLGWARKFIVLLDSDKKGRERKAAYLEEFGDILLDRLFTLEDVNPTWKNCDLEHLFTLDDKNDIIHHCYPSSKKYSKMQFNRALQEIYLKKFKITLEQHAMDSFNSLFDFFRKHLK